MDAVNHQFRLAARPVGLPKPSDWSYTEEPVAEPGDGEVLVKIAYVSLDPAMRGWMNDGRSYIPPVGIGEVMRAFAVGEVIASKDADVAGRRPRRRPARRAGVRDRERQRRVQGRPEPRAAAGVPRHARHAGRDGVLRPARHRPPKAGRDGRGLGRGGRGRRARRADREDQGLPRRGDRGRPREVRAPARGPRLRRHDRLQVRGRRRGAAQSIARTGIDVYFDNVGGEILDAALAHLARNARVVICGAICQYNNTTPRARAVQLPVAARQPREHDRLHDVRLHRPLRRGGARRWRAGSRPGKLVSREDIAEGLENFPETLLRLFSGENTGKLVLKI